MPHDSTNRRILLEVIVSSLDDARAAAAGGADRFEMCSALALGGLTPSLGTLTAVKAEIRTPVMFMIRPREAGMAYTAGELIVMERDAELALEQGADGLVFGCLTQQGAVDVKMCQRLMRLVRQKPGALSTFHRAFDVVADPVAALEQIIDLGFNRVLTSGRAALAIDGLDQIRRTVEQAAGRIGVLPGGGLGTGNVEKVVKETGVHEVHLSLTKGARDLSTGVNPAVKFAVDQPPTEIEYRTADEQSIRQVRGILDRMSG
jgi:copper homeostasis protein